MITNEKQKKKSWKHIATLDDAQKFIDEHEVKSMKDLVKRFGGLHSKCYAKDWVKQLKFPPRPKIIKETPTTIETEFGVFKCVEEVQELVDKNEFTIMKFRAAYPKIAYQCEKLGLLKKLKFSPRKTWDRLVTVDYVNQYLKENPNIKTLYQFRLKNPKLYKVSLQKNILTELNIDFYDPNDNKIKWSMFLKNKEDVISFLTKHNVTSLKYVTKNFGGLVRYLLKRGWTREVNLQMKNSWKEFKSIEDIQNFIDEKGILSRSEFRTEYPGVYNRCYELGFFIGDLSFKEEGSSESYGESVIKSFINDRLRCDNSFKDLLEKSKKVDGIEGRNKNYVFPDAYFIYMGETYWIEYNGEQHYEFINLYFRTPEDFEKQKKRDQSVRDYCKDHNIIYIEIPFTFDTKESIDNILTDVILNGNFKDRQIIL